MTNQLLDPFIIKIEPEEVDFNKFKLGLGYESDESFDSTKENNFSNQKDTAIDEENIKHLKQKLQKSQNKLKTVSYRNKVKHAHMMLFKNKLIKENKSLKRENFKLKQKLIRFEEFNGCLKRLCANFNDLDANQDKISINSPCTSSSSNQNITQSIDENKSFNACQSMQIDTLPNEILNQTIVEHNQSIHKKNPFGRSISKNLKPLAKLKLNQKLNKITWEGFKSKGNFLKSDLNEIQSKEINDICNNFEDFLKTKGYDTVSHFMQKNNSWFNLRRKCKKCKAAWYLKVIINEEYAQIFYNEECKHFSNN